MLYSNGRFLQHIEVNHVVGDPEKVTKALWFQTFDPQSEAFVMWFFQSTGVNDAARRDRPGVTAITAQGVHRIETAFTILQQTQTSAWTANADTLIRERPGIIMLWAHGSDCSPTVKSRSEALTPLRGVLHDAAPAPTGYSGYHRADSNSPTKRPWQANTAINTSQPGSHGPLQLAPSFAATHKHQRFDL